MTSRQYVLIRLWLSIGLLGCGLLFVMCLVPNPPSANVANVDKIEHFIAYLLLGTWFAGILPARWLSVFVSLAALGAAIELVQAWSGYRDGEWGDFLADCLGAAAGIGLARLGAMNWLRYIDARVAAGTRNR